MKEYEVTLTSRKNARIAELEDIVYVLCAENKKQATEFAYEVYRSERSCPLSREMFKITADRVRFE